MIQKRRMKRGIARNEAEMHTIRITLLVTLVIGESLFKLVTILTLLIIIGGESL